MEATNSTATERSAASRDVSIEILDRLFGSVEPHDFGFVLWDGTVWGEPARSAIHLCHEGALRAMYVPPNDVTIGEAFVRGDFDIVGDIERAIEAGQQAAETKRSPAEYAQLAVLLFRLPATRAEDSEASPACLLGSEHCKQRDRAAIQYHYDVSNDFYALWLDDEMAYSCAYFQDGQEDIHTAQRAKFDHVCRKLHLEPGERVLDIGCGWGGLLRHAAREFGVEGVGITLSEQQASFASERAATVGLSDRLHFEVLDYRDVHRLGSFDKLVSIGMFEHVGAEHLPVYFQRAMDVLTPGGLFLNHGIAANEKGYRAKGNSFIQRYVFPDGQLEPVSRVLTAAEQVGFEIRDVESLREHYAMTLRHWVKRLESRAQEAQLRTSRETYRIWRLYMAGSAHGFRRGKISVFQSLLAKPTGDVSGLPLTRGHLYE